MTVMFRSALIAFGRNPPPELAYITRRHIHESWTVVTFAEIAEEKRRRQREILEYKRQVSPQRRAWMVWVFYNATFFYGGWHGYLIRYDGEDEWVITSSRKQELMRLFPLVLPFGSVEDQWGQWKVEFARQYKRRTRHGKPAGMAPVWWDGHHGKIEPAEERTVDYGLKTND